MSRGRDSKEIISGTILSKSRGKSIARIDRQPKSRSKKEKKEDENSEELYSIKNFSI
ncbi:hypothetical protein KW799_00910 [Candidatus Parcubacteria bacterium]|nr:hypothetical protein [Candidatus Parcubacteria bacterium]